jgi:hypothetical protein
MRYLLLTIMSLTITGCISSQDFTKSTGASHLTNQCYKLNKPTFVFEGRCADLTGINDNSELCNSLQVAGEGGFPQDWKSYLKSRKIFDKKMFDRLAFEKQRTMFAYLENGDEITITKVVHHGWGTNGLYWVVRGNVIVNGKITEVELPSFNLVHHEPFWLNGNEKGVPALNSEYIESCK